MGTLMSNGRKVLMVFSRDGKLCTKTYTSDGKLAWELEGDMLLKFAVDVKKGDTLVRISGTNVVADADYKIGDYLYFAKGTFQPTEIRFYINANEKYDHYSEIRFLKGLDISRIKSFYRILGGWDGTTGVKKIDVSHFDTKNVTDMSSTFCNCSSPTSLDVSNFDTKNVTAMSTMFSGCRSLTSLDVSKFNTENVTLMNHMFYYCSSLTTLDVSNFDTSKVTAMSSMFSGCRSLTSLDVSNFDTKNVTAMSSTFRECNKLPVLNVSGFNTSRVTSMYYTFFGCNVVTALDVSKWVTNKVTDFCSMFGWCQKLESLDVSNFDLGVATNISNMFYQCQSLTNLIFGSKWGTQTSTAADALTLDLSSLGSSKSYKLTDETYNSMLTMYDRASNGLTTMTIKFSTKHNLPDGFAEKMSALGYTITLV